MSPLIIGLIALGVLVVLGGLALLVAVTYRKVVPTNEVHIVQYSKAAVSYGKDTGHGNTYYAWPASLPIIGVTSRILPTSVFDLDLIAYEAYDKGRLPFVVDVKSFFRITDSNLAAQRVESKGELEKQILAMVQGAVRVILASTDIESILDGRSTFGEQFTKEVAGHLAAWGVENVKNIELMDIRDAKDSHVIRNIMEKKKSYIEMESRTEVAKNQQMAQIAEIEAKREVDIQSQQASQVVGLRTIEAKKQVELQNQEMIQAVKEQEKATMERDMAIAQVRDTRTAEIARDVQLVKAGQDRDTKVIAAEATLEAKKRESEGLKVQGLAEADAKQAMEMAPINAQIALAKEIGENQGYQTYLITLRKVEADQAVGIEQAKALNKAEIKIIANAGDASSGLNKALDVFSSKGGTQLGAMLEGLANTPTGKAVLEKLT